ncbi:MAG TPA: TonB C-terminal domain-containing protein [Rickettsiales bacterium]|nr:TonB C-terminal domain-containing protein [Rickettsiales bacterium]
MRVSMSKGQKYSLGLHLALLLFMIFGVPDFLHRKFDEQPVAISVDILPISKISNVKPHPQSEPQKKQPVAEKQTERKAKEETHQKAPPPPPKKEEVVKKEPEKPKETPIPVKKEPPKKEEKKKVEKKKEPEKPKEKKEDDLDSILKSVEKQAKAEESKHPTQQKTEPNQHKAVSDHYNATQPLSMSETDAIRQQLEQCWTPPEGAKDAGNLAVLLKISVNQDGTITSVNLAQDRNRYNSDTFFRAAADSAMRAVRECSPLKHLPEGKYDTWREMELNFDPKDL